MSLSLCIERLTGGLLGVLLPLALLLVGTVYAVALRFFPLFHPVRTLKKLFHGQKREALRALSLALAGTLGVGNIAGVALAVAVGGAGAVVWMWISAALAMLLKYAEIVLALLYREGEGGGAMLYMKNGLGGRVGKLFATLFSLFCIASALSLGGMVQANAVAESAFLVFRVPPLCSGLLLALLSLLAVTRGAKGIGALTSRLIPLLTVFYFGISLYAVLTHLPLLPSVLARIFEGAASPWAAAGGAGGFFSVRAMRYGVTRGLLSNEAGAGTAPMAHATAKTDPVCAGVLGMAEVFIDTFVLCTATAFAVLLAFPDGIPALGGVSLVLRAFSSLVGAWTAVPVTLSVLLFVYATVVCWCFYGECATRYLAPRKGARVAYLCLFHLFLLLGALFHDETVWLLTDTAVAVMTLLNLIALLALMPKVREETKRCALMGTAQ